MPIFEIRQGGLAAVSATSFEAEKLKERGDIQRILKERIEVLGDRLMVLAEEFSGWLDSSRRIDLLCLDADANLVVIELKRTEDGGHMELQALRYAAMVSAMTFEQAVDALARHRNKATPEHDAARAEILAFLGADAPDAVTFGSDTRIILAAADFSKELTTTVMWLRDREIDIRCIRLKPYRLEDDRLLVDVQQLIPLPEAADFQTQLGVKRLAERKDREERHDLRFRFWEGLLSKAKERTMLHAGSQPSIGNWIAGSIGRSGFSLSYVIRRTDAQVELWIAQDTEAFRQLLAQQGAIETEFGAPLDWNELPHAKGSRIRYLVDGGYSSPPEKWPQIQDALIDAMIRLDRVFRARLHAIRP